jgi:hypothetical protein
MQERSIVNMMICTGRLFRLDNFFIGAAYCISHRGSEPNLQIKNLEQNNKASKFEDLHICYLNLAGIVNLFQTFESRETKERLIADIEDIKLLLDKRTD